MGSTSTQPTVTDKVLAMVYFGVSSTVVMFFTKAVFTSWGFKFPLIVAFLQQAVTFPVAYAVDQPPITVNLVLDKAPLAAANMLNLVTGLMGTGDISMPMFVALRRFTMVFTLILEYALYRKTRDAATKLAVVLMISGAFFAALTDLSFNVRGYVAVGLNDLFSSLYMLLVKYRAAGLSRTGLMCYNAMMAIPVLLAACLIKGDFRGAAAFEYALDPTFLLVLLGTTVMGLFVTHSMFVCTQVNDAIMTSVVGVIKNILTTVVGAVVFPDYQASLLNVVALSVSTVGATWYAVHAARKKEKPVKVDDVVKSPRKAGRGEDVEMQKLLGLANGHRKSGAGT